HGFTAQVLARRHASIFEQIAQRDSTEHSGFLVVHVGGSEGDVFQLLPILLLVCPGMEDIAAEFQNGRSLLRERRKRKKHASSQQPQGLHWREYTRRLPWEMIQVESL